jgi:hypothetical protein
MTKRQLLQNNDRTSVASMTMLGSSSGLRSSASARGDVKRTCERMITASDRMVQEWMETVGANCVNDESIVVATRSGRRIKRAVMERT